MKCSDCHRDIKPVVAIDIDGTLGDYHGHFLKFALAWLGDDYEAPVNDYDGSEPHREWFTRVMDVDVSTFRAIKLAFRQGGMKRTMPIYQDSRWMIEELRFRLDAELWLTTTRPWERFDRVDPDTRHWLSQHGLGFDGLIYDDDKMNALAACVNPLRVVTVVDDLTEVLEEADQLFENAITIKRSTPHNRGTSWPREGYMGLIYKTIEGSATRWRETYG